MSPDTQLDPGFRKEHVESYWGGQPSYRTCGTDALRRGIYAHKHHLPHSASDSIRDRGLRPAGPCATLPTLTRLI